MIDTENEREIKKDKKREGERELSLLDQVGFVGIRIV